MRAWGDRLDDGERRRVRRPREVVVEYRVEMFRFARSLSRNDADAEDLAQSAASAGARARRRLRDPERAKAYLLHDRAQPRDRPGACGGRAS